MVHEQRLEKHGTRTEYVIKTYDSSTDWIRTEAKEMVYTLSGMGWQIQYELADIPTKLEVGSKFLLPENVKYKKINKENRDLTLTLKVEFI